MGGVPALSQSRTLQSAETLVGIIKGLFIYHLCFVSPSILQHRDQTGGQQGGRKKKTIPSLPLPATDTVTDIILSSLTKAGTVNMYELYIKDNFTERKDSTMQSLA